MRFQMHTKSAVGRIPTVEKATERPSHNEEGVL